MSQIKPYIYFPMFKIVLLALELINFRHDTII